MKWSEKGLGCVVQARLACRKGAVMRGWVDDDIYGFGDGL